MPPLRLWYFGTSPMSSPVIDWINELTDGTPIGQSRYDICRTLIEQLERSGSDLRRPTSAPLGGGLYELRGSDRQGTPVRLIFAFAGTGRALLLAGCVKRSAGEFERAKSVAARRLVQFKADPIGHTFR